MTHPPKIRRFSAVATLLVATLALPSLTFAQLTNPSAELPNEQGTGPDGWTPQQWGDVKAELSWGNIGADGGRSLQVDVSAVGAEGDARWLSDAVAAKGGATYTLAVRYRATVAARLAAQALGANGESQWLHVADTTLASDWTLASGSFTLPPWATKVRVGHLLAKVGSLWTDDYQLGEKAAIARKDGATNAIPNPSFEEAAAEAEGGDAGAKGWSFVAWGAAKGSGTAVKANGSANAADGGRYLKATLTTAAADADIKWWTDPIPVTPGEGDWLLSAQTRGDARVLLGLLLTDKQGKSAWRLLKWTAPSQDWTRTTVATALPADVDTVRVAAIINAVGSVELDDFSFMRAAAGGDPGGALNISVAVDATDGSVWPAVNALRKRGLLASFYVPTAVLSSVKSPVVKNLVEAQTIGHEIGVFGEDPSTWAKLASSERRAAVIRAYSRFRELNLNAVGFATPDNAYDDGVVEAVDSASGYLRTLAAGTNYPPFAYLEVLVRDVTSSTSSLTLKRWANEARRHGAWLVIRYAGVGGANGAVTEARFAADVDDLLAMGANVAPVGTTLKRWQKPKPGNVLSPEPGKDFFGCSASPTRPGQHRGALPLAGLALLALLALGARRRRSGLRG